MHAPPVLVVVVRFVAHDDLRLRNRRFSEMEGLTQNAIVDAFCIATYHSGSLVPTPESNIYHISFRPKQTRKHYYSLSQKGKGRVRYQVNDELERFRKGDIVLVRGKYIKQINSIYSEGRLAFKQVKGEPPSAFPKDCRMLERVRTIFWESRFPLTS